MQGNAAKKVSELAFQKIRELQGDLEEKVKVSTSAGRRHTSDWHACMHVEPQGRLPLWSFRAIGFA